MYGGEGGDEEVERKENEGGLNFFPQIALRDKDFGKNSTDRSLEDISRSIWSIKINERKMLT